MGSSALIVFLGLISGFALQQWMVPSSWDAEQDRVLLGYHERMRSSTLFNGKDDVSVGAFQDGLLAYFQSHLAETPQVSGWNVDDAPSSTKLLSSFADQDGDGRVSVVEATDALMLQSVFVKDDIVRGNVFAPPIRPAHWVHLRRDVFGTSIDGSSLFAAFTSLWKALIVSLVVHAFSLVATHTLSGGGDRSSAPSAGGDGNGRASGESAKFAKRSSSSSSAVARRSTPSSSGANVRPGGSDHDDVDDVHLSEEKDGFPAIVSLVSGILGSAVLPFLLVFFGVVLAVATSHATFERLALEDVGPFSLCLLLWMQSVRGVQVLLDGSANKE